MPRNSLRWILTLLLTSCLLAILCDDAFSQRGRRSKGRSKKRTSTRRVEPVDVTPPTATCYKLGTDLDQVPLEFEISGYQWPQQDGDGSPIELNYSYHNLLEGQIEGLTPDEIRLAVEEALALWASVAPLHFVEVVDSGPEDSDDDSYDAEGAAHIRIGAHFLDGPNGALAHAFLPYSDEDGAAGDVHLDSAEDWSLADGGFLLEVILHELGHSLGLDHEEEIEAIMNPIIAERFEGLGEGYLLPDDIAGVQAIYGEGVGSLTPLEETPEEEPEDDPPPDEPDEEEPQEEDPQDDDETEEDEPEQEPSDNNATLEADSDSNTVNITGDGQNNELTVLSARWATMVVGNGETTVNGNRADIVFHDAGPNVECNMQDGDDFVLFFRLGASTAEVNMGAGDDALILLFCWIGELMTDGGADTDLLLRLGTVVEELVELDYEYSY